MSVLKRLLSTIREKDYDLIDMEKDFPADQTGMAVILSVHLPSKSAHEEVIRLVGTIDGVTYVEKI